MLIVATAGHIDHGKTTLVRALTGVDTDRLPEEKARGISIDLGFAYRRLPDGGLIGFVDVPGHERFLRNMVAGVCGIDFALLVVAADDGVMPQTREHLAILQLLAVPRGAVVLSKVDRVDSRRADTVAREVQDLLAGTRLAGAEVFRSAGPGSAGVAALAQCLEREARQVAPPAPAAAGRFRFAIDRAFGIAGSGTVVTGTVLAGEVRTGDPVMVSPAGLAARVRRLRVHDQDAPRAQTGERCALNLAGVELSRLGRGDWVLDAALHRPTQHLDVKLELLPSVPRALQHRQLVQLHLGTAALAAQVLLPRAAALPAGGSGFARLQLSAAALALHGDRFVLRDAASHCTLGGGLVLDPFAAPLQERGSARELRLRALDQASPAAALAALAQCQTRAIELDWFQTAFNLAPPAAAAAVEAAGLQRLGRSGGRADLAMARERLAEARGHVLALLAGHHREHPRADGEELGALARSLGPVLPREGLQAVLAGLADEQCIRVAGNKVRLSGHDPTARGDDRRLWQRLQPRLAQAGFTPPTARELASRLQLEPGPLAAFLHRKVERGELLRVGPDRFYLRRTVLQLAQLAAAVAQAQPGGEFSVAQFRDRAATGRGLALQILECLDRQRITQRHGEVRRISHSALQRWATLCPPALPARPSWRQRHRFTAGVSAP